jgi:hypothetical protein
MFNRVGHRPASWFASVKHKSSLQLKSIAPERPTRGTLNGAVVVALALPVFFWMMQKLGSPIKFSSFSTKKPKRELVFRSGKFFRGNSRLCVRIFGSKRLTIGEPGTGLRAESLGHKSANEPRR